MGIYCLVWLPAPGHSVMMSSLASVLVEKANATPEKVVPCGLLWSAFVRAWERCYPRLLTKSMPTMSWALERPSPATSAMVLVLLYTAGGP